MNLSQRLSNVQLFSTAYLGLTFAEFDHCLPQYESRGDHVVRMLRTWRRINEPQNKIEDLCKCFIEAEKTILSQTVLKHIDEVIAGNVHTCILLLQISGI